MVLCAISHPIVCLSECTFITCPLTSHRNIRYLYKRTRTKVSVNADNFLLYIINLANSPHVFHWQFQVLAVFSQLTFCLLLVRKSSVFHAEIKLLLPCVSSVWINNVLLLPQTFIYSNAFLYIYSQMFLFASLVPPFLLQFGLVKLLELQETATT